MLIDVMTTGKNFNEQIFTNVKNLDETEQNEYMI